MKFVDFEIDTTSLFIKGLTLLLGFPKNKNQPNNKDYLRCLLLGGRRLVLGGRDEVLDSEANSVGNIDIISYHLVFPSHMMCKYWRCFIAGTLCLLVLFGGSDVLSVGFSSYCNSVGNIDIISYHLAFPSHMICKYWRSFISGTLYFLVLSGGSDVLSVGFSS